MQREVRADVPGLLQSPGHQQAGFAHRIGQQHAFGNHRGQCGGIGTARAVGLGDFDPGMLKFRNVAFITKYIGQGFTGETTTG